MEKFSLENQYQLYLKRVALTESKMHPDQRRETRQAFMGACGQMIFLLRDELASLEEDEAIAVLEKMKNEVGNFFIKHN